MVCCAVIAMLLAGPLWLVRKMHPFRWGLSADPLAWRPSAHASGASAAGGPRFSLRARAASFSHAARGLTVMCRREHNAWLHLAAAILVVAAGIALEVAAADWRWLVLAIALVLTAEALNTAIERVCDRFTTAHCDLVRDAKDIAAGAVLVAAIAAAAIGALTFAPYLRAIMASRLSADIGASLCHAAI
jgi:diacylglycerol kinase (ATP)